MPFGRNRSREITVYKVDGTDKKSPMPFGSHPLRDMPGPLARTHGNGRRQCLSAVIPFGTSWLQSKARARLKLVANAFRQSSPSGLYRRIREIGDLPRQSPMPFGSHPLRDYLHN